MNEMTGGNKRNDRSERVFVILNFFFLNDSVIRIYDGGLFKYRR